MRAQFANRDHAPPGDTFSQREVAILRLLAGGYPNEEIARSIHLSEGTVRNYVSEILEKPGPRDRTRAALQAIPLPIIRGGGRSRADASDAQVLQGRLREGDELVYEIQGDRVVLLKAQRVRDADDPFRTFGEGDSSADRKAYRDL